LHLLLNETFLPRPLINIGQGFSLGRLIANSFLQTNGDSDRHDQSGGWHPILDLIAKDAESLNQ
jgi:hypothetical protein